MNRDRLRVLLVDDHTVVRQGLRRVLETNADFEVIGEVGNGSAALAGAAIRTRPAIAGPIVASDRQRLTAGTMDFIFLSLPYLPPAMSVRTASVGLLQSTYLLIFRKQQACGFARRKPVKTDVSHSKTMLRNA